MQSMETQGVRDDGKAEAISLESETSSAFHLKAK